MINTLQYAKKLEEAGFSRRKLKLIFRLLQKSLRATWLQKVMLES